MAAPYFCAGYAFGPAQAIRQCRYDPHTPMLFDGEELSYAVRLYTHGYNLCMSFFTIILYFV